MHHYEKNSFTDNHSHHFIADSFGSDDGFSSDDGFEAGADSFGSDDGYKAGADSFDSDDGFKAGTDADSGAGADAHRYT